MSQKLSWLMPLILLLVIAACSPTGSEPGASPSGDEARQVAEDALPAARQALADYLDVAPEVLELEKIEDAEWSNACLGLARPDEVCAEVITPGFLITFTVEDQSYAVRTDLEGDAVGVEAAAGAPGPVDEPPPSVEAARTTLAQQLDVESGTIEVLNFEQQEWSDSCLGLGRPAESCAAVNTHGWQVMLRVESETYEVRTDETGEQVRVADEATEAPASS